jgi:hypothetical protein
LPGSAQFFAGLCYFQAGFLLHSLRLKNVSRQYIARIFHSGLTAAKRGNHAAMAKEHIAAHVAEQACPGSPQVLLSAQPRPSVTEKCHDYTKQPLIKKT